MRNLAILIAAFVMSTSTAWAQSTADIVRDTVFSEVEKRIIGRHYGVDVQQQSQDSTMPTWAVKDGQDEQGDDARDDEDDDRDKADRDKKNKNKKNKDKGHKKDKGKSKGMPPGLAKRDSLPPGLQKQLDKNGRLPPGLAKRDLPSDLASKLPERTADQDVVVVENDVVLMDKATGVILDVLKDVVRNGAGAGQTPTTSPDGTLVAPGPQNPDATPQGGALDAILKSIFGGN